MAVEFAFMAAIW